MSKIIPVNLIEFSEAFNDVDRYMDIWDWLVSNGHILVSVVDQNSRLFYEVATVLGEEEAIVQLNIAAPSFTTDDLEHIDNNVGLFQAFNWGKTPQGAAYWHHIYKHNT